MVEPLSSLNNVRLSDATASAGVSLTEIHPFSLIQIAAWPDSFAQAGKFAAASAGCDHAPGPGQSMVAPEGSLLRIEPLKWWLITQDPARSLPEFPDDAGALVDLSHARTWIRISGGKAETLLNHFLPLDLRDGAFPVGTVASTAFHHIGVTLWRETTGYSLLLPSGFARSLFEMLVQTARQYQKMSDDLSSPLSLEGV